MLVKFPVGEPVKIGVNGLCYRPDATDFVLLADVTPPTIRNVDPLIRLASDL